MTWLSAVLEQLKEHWVKAPNWLKALLYIAALICIAALIKGHWVEALINFTATFAGVFVSFWVERRRSTNQEKDDFGKVLQSLLVESSTNYARLESIKYSSVGKVPGYSLTNQLALVLGSPMLHRWAKHSLVLAATIVSTHIEFVNNLLARLRTANQNQILEQTIEELKGAAKRGQELILVMQGLIEAELPSFGGSPKADAKLNETREKLQSI
jgi:hypothetical protein